MDFTSKPSVCHSTTLSAEPVLKLIPVNALSRPNSNIPAEKQPVTMDRRLRMITAKARAQQSKAAPNANAELEFKSGSMGRAN